MNCVKEDVLWALSTRLMDLAALLFVEIIVPHHPTWLLKRLTISIRSYSEED